MLSIPRFFATSSHPSLFRFLVLLGILAMGSVFSRADDNGAGPNLLSGNFESGSETFNPWGGVDDSGNLHVWSGGQFAVDDSGNVNPVPISPGVAVGDLNGDGLPDLVVADPRGFFWYYPNSGKPNNPIFTHGEVMPVWVGDIKLTNRWSRGDMISRVQLIDYDNDGKLDLVVGNYFGELYYVHNGGSTTMPNFHVQSDLSNLAIDTHSQGLLWCNYLSPYLYDWSKTGRLDLVMGDGSYSANSIYLFTNQSANGYSRPVFNERHRDKVIPGMGREHLTPQVVDWNNDGKPDIIAGERAGFVDLYLNQSAEKGGFPPVFDKDKPQHIQFGSVDNVGEFPAISVADLNNDHLFDLVVATADGRICYSFNTGTPGNPKFGPLVPFKGVYPFQQKVYLPANWEIDRNRPYGVPYGLLECTNAKLEPGFIPPPETKLTGAAKFSVVDIHPVYFKDKYEADTSGSELDGMHAINYKGDPIVVQAGARYILGLWTRSQGTVSNIIWTIHGVVASGDKKGQYVEAQGSPFDAGSAWNRVHNDFSVLGDAQGSKDTVGVSLSLNWTGDGTLYLDDITLKKAD